MTVAEIGDYSLQCGQRRTGSGAVCCVDMLTDDLIRISVIWSSKSVFGKAVVDTLAVSIGLNDRLMLLYGYAGCFLMMTVVRELAKNAIEQSEDEIYRLRVERTYVAVSAVTVYMLRRGIQPNKGYVCMYM